MERAKLKAARIAKGLREGKKITQQMVADAIGCSRDIVGLWELGECDPQQHYRDALCTYYEVEDPRDLDLVPASQILSLGEIIKMLERYDRRELIAALQSLPAFAALDLVSLLESPNVAPDVFLNQCDAGIKACWHL